MKNSVGKSQFWQKYAPLWSQVRPPVRPSQEDIRLYNLFLQKTIGKLKRPQILILGATPELRDLASQYSATVTVLDYSLEMIIAMTRLMRKENPAEVWVKGDWVDAPLRENYYDAILGDGVYNNVGPELSRSWWLHLRALLKPSGALVTRIAVMIDPEARQELLAQVLRALQGGRVYKKEQLGALHIAVQITSHNPRRQVTRSVDKQVFKKAVRFMHLSPKEENRIYQAFIKIYPVVYKEWRFSFPERTEREIKKYFAIKAAVKNRKSLFADVLPIYFLKK